MSDVEIKLKVTQERFDEFFSIEDWLNFGDMTDKEVYNIMINFVVDDKGEQISPENARKLFKKVKKTEWSQYINDFINAINDTFVSPTKGGS